MLHIETADAVQYATHLNCWRCTICYTSKLLTLYNMLHIETANAVQYATHRNCWRCTMCYTLKLLTLYNMLHIETADTVQYATHWNCWRCTICYTWKFKTCYALNCQICKIKKDWNQQYNAKRLAFGIFEFPQKCCWRFKCYGMLHCVDW